MYTKRNWTRCFSFTVALAAIIAAISIQTADAADKATLRLDWKVYGTHALFFIGLKKGFYAAEGIDLEIKEGNGSPEVVKLIGAGNDTFGFAAGVNTLEGVSRGLPVRSVYGVFRRDPLAVMSFKSANINKPADLIGKTVSTSGTGAAGALFKTFLGLNKIDPSTVKLAALGMGGRNRALLSGQVAAMVGYSVTDVPSLHLAGHDMAVMNFADWGLNAVSNGIIVNASLEAKSPDLIKRFLRALSRSIDYARTNPQEAADDLAQRAPLANKQALLEELNWTIGLLSSDETKDKALGWQAESDWQRTLDVLVEGGIIEKRPALSDAFTNGYLSQ